MRLRLATAWNIVKAWLLVQSGCALLAAIALPFHEYRIVSLLVFFGLLVAGAAYWYGDRVALGMVGARELPLGENPALHGTVERLAVALARHRDIGQPHQRRLPALGLGAARQRALGLDRRDQAILGQPFDQVTQDQGPFVAGGIGCGGGQGAHEAVNSGV